jgi:hypothetical protein
VVASSRNWVPGSEQVGTVGGNSDGTVIGNLTIGAINFTAGNTGVNYDFVLIPNNG